jgi:ribosomal protein S18 acetylase RimI-like enzyme
MGMIKISKATKKDTKEWGDKEWYKADITHFGKHFDWDKKKFRFKAEENGKIVGLISGDYKGAVLYIGTIITAEGERGKGIGTTLIKKAEEFGKKLGAHKTWLITGKGWSENTFYQKLGFKIISELPDFYFHKDFVIYTKEIK